MASGSSVSELTLSIGPLLPPLSNKEAVMTTAAAVLLSTGDEEYGQNACDGETVVVEGVSFAVVIVIAFAAFTIGVMLMSSLWFIYVKTSECSRFQFLLLLITV